MSDVVLSVDLGTGGPKVGLVTLDGDVLDHEVHSVATHFDDGGSATQDAEEWWQLVAAATKRLTSAHATHTVVAVAVTGLFASTVPVDVNGHPVGPALTWLDTHGRPYAQQVIGGRFLGYNARRVLKFLKYTGGAPSTAGADPVGQILAFEAEHPAEASRAAWYLEPIDYLSMRFCGVPHGTHASRLAMWMTDNRHMDNMAYHRGLVSLVGLPYEKLPPLVPFGSLVGGVTADAAAHTGLPEGTPVMAGCPDLHAAAMGAGATDLYATHAALSTTSWVSCPVPSKKTDILHGIAAVPGLTQSSYVAINNQETAAKALDWFRQTWLGGEKPSYDELTALAATSPPGARGVVFTPWLAGERSPVDDKTVRGGLYGLAVDTTTADVARAVMEGVACNLAWLHHYVEKFAGRELSPVRIVGGGAQSPLWCQMVADATGRVVEQVPSPLTAQLRGVALLAGVALGRYSMSEAAQRLTPGRQFTPSADAPLLQQRWQSFPKRFALAKRLGKLGRSRTLPPR